MWPFGSRSSVVSSSRFIYLLGLKAKMAHNGGTNGAQEVGAHGGPFVIGSQGGEVGGGFGAQFVQQDWAQGNRGETTLRHGGSGVPGGSKNRKFHEIMI